MTESDESSEYAFYLPLNYGPPFNDPLPSALLELIKTRMVYLFGVYRSVACAAPGRALPDNRVDVFKVKCRDRSAIYEFAYGTGRAILHRTMAIGLPNGHRLMIAIDCDDLFDDWRIH